MKNYREQDGCWNCRKCIRFYEDFDCNADNSAPEDPRYSTIPMGSKKFWDMDKNWVDWQTYHDVEPWGICDEWEGE